MGIFPSVGYTAEQKKTLLILTNKQYLHYNYNQSFELREGYLSLTAQIINYNYRGVLYESEWSDLGSGRGKP